MVPRNSTSGGFAYIWESTWVGIIAIKNERTQFHFLSDVLIAVASLDLKVPIVFMGGENLFACGGSLFFLTDQLKWTQKILWTPWDPRCNSNSGEGGFVQMMYRSPEGHLRTSGMEFFGTVPRPHFLGRTLIWPCCFGERILGLFGLYPSSLSKSVGFVSLSGKASLVSISAAILFLRSWHVYFPLEFEFRGKRCVEWEHVGENGISCFLPCILLL